MCIMNSILQVAWNCLCAAVSVTPELRWSSGERGHVYLIVIHKESTGDGWRTCHGIPYICGGREEGFPEVEPIH
jgi:hypothetical protein